MMQERLYNVYASENPQLEEAYRVLRTNIQYMGLEKKIKKLSVTSYKNGEGKTTTAINLAVSMAETGLKTLLVDADMRKSMVMKRLGSYNFTGLSNYLAGYEEIPHIISKTTVPGLDFIACGVKPVKPVELLESSRFHEFIEKIEKLYDMVIFDCPPLGQVIDCAVVTKHMDGALVVVRTDAVSNKKVQQVLDQFARVNANVLGLVLNGMHRSYYKKYTSHYSDHGTARKLSRGWFAKIKKGSGHND